MFSLKQKREISDAVQKVLRATNHPELGEGKVKFTLDVWGESKWSSAQITQDQAERDAKSIKDDQS